MLVLGIVIGLAIAVLLIALFVWFSLWFVGKFSNLDEAQFRDLILKLLIHGENYETLNFDETNGDAFAQFKKYIHSSDNFGVDFVFPIIGRYSGQKPKVLKLCEKYKLHCELIESENGWFFAFIQMNDGATIRDDAVYAAIELADLDFSKNVGVSENSTFKWRRKDKVLGNQKLSKDDPSRYDIRPDTSDR